MRTFECTIFGIDAGGYAWMNVFHVTSTNDEANEHLILDALNTVLSTDVVGEYKLCMSSQCKILGVSSKKIKPEASYTLTVPLDIDGTRDLDALPGPVNGKVVWLPETGKSVGHQFIAGTCKGDYDNDRMSDAYEGLLVALISAFTALDGTEATYAWQFVIYNRKTFAAIAVVAGTALLTATYLSKRARA